MKNKVLAIVTFGLFGLSILYIVASIIGSKYDGSKDVEDAKENSDIVLVDFWADGCKPCKKISPYIEEIKTEYTDVSVLSVDINSEDGLHKDYNIRFVPTVIIFYQGEEFVRLVGYHEKKEYTDYLDALIHPNQTIMMEFEWK